MSEMDGLVPSMGIVLAPPADDGTVFAFRIKADCIEYLVNMFGTLLVEDAS